MQGGSRDPAATIPRKGTLKGIVRAATEFMSAEEENSPSVLILNMGSSPVYTNTVHLNTLTT